MKALHPLNSTETARAHGLIICFSSSPARNKSHSQLHSPQDSRSSLLKLSQDWSNLLLCFPNTNTKHENWVSALNLYFSPSRYSTWSWIHYSRYTQHETHWGFSSGQRNHERWGKMMSWRAKGSLFALKEPGGGEVGSLFFFSFTYFKVGPLGEISALIRRGEDHATWGYSKKATAS